MIKLENLDGHLIKWAKGHYPDRSFDDVVRAVCAFPGKHGIRERIRMLLRAFAATGQAKPHILNSWIDNLLFRASVENNRVTSYHLLEGDSVKLTTIEASLKSSLACDVVVLDHTGVCILELPKELTDEDFARYEAEA